jgi:hypothetical protein
MSSQNNHYIIKKASLSGDLFLKQRSLSVRLDRSYRASACAGTAADALFGIDLELAVALGDGSNGTLTRAGTAADTGITNRICHY